MVNTDATTGGIITSKELPAILVGGPKHAGKSTLTYNLTRELRRCAIPHYVFRASTDYEGDWFMEGDLDTVRDIRFTMRKYPKWTDAFRAFVCRDLAHRYLPLIVDLGGIPQIEDTCIFRVCTHSVLLLKDGEEEATRTWRHFAGPNGLLPLAELRSQQQGKELLKPEGPVIAGTITTGVKRGDRMDGPVFKALLRRIGQLFLSFSPDELEKLHLDDAPVEQVVHLPHHLHALAPDLPYNHEMDIQKRCDCLDREGTDLSADSDALWTPRMLRPLLKRLPAQSEMAVYGRAPGWVYGALALHAGTQPFYQFDARIGWRTPPVLQAGAAPSSESPITIDQDQYNGAYILSIHLVHNYLDYQEADQLVFPEPPPGHGVIVNGKLPLWLFTALARFYAQRNASWIALNDARNDRPVVIYAQVATHPIGMILPKLPKLPKL